MSSAVLTPEQMQKLRELQARGDGQNVTARPHGGKKHLEEDN